MKRFLPAAGVAVLFGAMVLVQVTRSPATTGPEPGSGDFAIFVDETGQGLNREYDRTTYETALGWDFGDRAAYACAFVEHFTDGALDFEIHLELFAGYPVPVEINDRNGQEGQEGTFSCGDGIAKGANLIYDPAVYGDHFPHGDFFADQQVSDLVFYRDLDADGFVDDEFARVDYSKGDPCDQAYWTPGNDAGEAVLWWDEDGPSSPDGHQALGCDPANGPLEPAAVAVIDVQDVAPGVGFCTVSIDEVLCEGVTFEPPVTPVQLGSGLSELTCPDASVPNLVQTSPLRVSCP